MKTTTAAITASTSAGSAGTTVSTSTTLIHKPDQTGPDSQGTISISGTFTGCTLAVQKKMVGGTVWLTVALLDEAALTSSSAPTPTDSTTASYRFACAGASLVRAFFSAGTPSAAEVEITTGTNAEFGGDRTVLNQAITASSSQTINAASATALVVGPNGATNPTVKVLTNTASAATGITVTSAAAGAGIAVAAISSGTNEALTLDGKGAAPVYLNRASLKAPVIGLTLTALGTVQSSTPTAAQLLGGLLTQTGATGAGTFTLPSGTTLATAMALTPAVGDSFQAIFANLGGGQTITITGATGTTVLGTAAVPTGKFATMTFINTGANAFSIYCVLSA